VLVAPGNEHDVVRRALAAIDSVHGDGSLRTVGVRRGRSRSEAAAYEWSLRTGEPLQLTFSVHAPRPELSIIHEVGHLLDHEAFGRNTRLGSELGSIPAIMAAIQASDACRWLDALATRKQVRLRLPNRRRPQILPIDASIVRYLREPTELFARAYAQLIATASQDARLLAQLDAIRSDPVLGEVYHSQWAERDFVPIARALEQELRDRQWIA
jgi:hypothetical protein